MGEEEKRAFPRGGGGRIKAWGFIIKDEFVGAIHELPLRDTTHMFYFLPLTFSQTIDRGFPRI